LQQAKEMLRPLLGDSAADIFAFALLLSGLASTITSGMAGGTIFAGLFIEPFDLKDRHSRIGVLTSFLLALTILFLIRDPFQGLIYSQMVLSIQLPFTIFLQIYLTSSQRVMGPYANSRLLNGLLLAVGLLVTYLNLRLLISALS